MIRRFGILLLVIGCIPKASLALPDVGLSIEADVTVQDGLQGSAIVDQVSLAPGPTISTPPMLINHLAGYSTLMGEVQYGAIDASASVLSPIQGAYTTASFFGIWQDYLTVTSSTLPYGAPVVLRGTMSYDLSSSCIGPYVGQVQEVVAFTLGVPQLYDYSSTCGSPLSGTQSMDVTTWVGAILSLEGQMSIFAGVYQETSAAIDPPMGFFIDPVTPGVSYTTGSGTSYLTPTLAAVPEPASIALVAFGLLGVATTRRRRSRH